MADEFAQLAELVSNAQRAALQEAVDTEVDRCIRIVEACKAAGRSDDWDRAIDYAVAALRGWKVHASEMKAAKVAGAGQPNGDGAKEEA